MSSRYNKNHHLEDIAITINPRSSLVQLERHVRGSARRERSKVSSTGDVVLDCHRQVIIPTKYGGW